MSTFKLVFDTDNSAFGEGDDARAEIARILRRVAERIDEGDEMNHHRTVLDINGNDVGRFVWLENADI